jgi:predicted lactoylglutathione lyase
MSSVLLDPTRLSLILWVNDLSKSKKFFETIGMKSFAYSIDHVLYGVDGLSLLVYHTVKKIPFHDAWAQVPHLEDNTLLKDAQANQVISIAVRQLDKIVKTLSRAGYRFQQETPVEYGLGLRAVQVKDQHGRNFLLVE